MRLCISLLLFLLFLGSDSTLVCRSYSCNAPNTLSWAGGVCGQADSNSTLYYFNPKACDKKQICNYNATTPDANSLCETVTPELQIDAYPGEECNDMHSCVISTCNSTTNMCQAKEPCVNYYDCLPGSFCQSGTCQSLYSLNSKCLHDYECPMNATCDNASDGSIGTCVEYLSLPAGSIVQSCDDGNALVQLGFGTNNACQSDTCYSFGGGVFKCAEAVSSQSTVLPIQCIPEKTCFSQRDSTSNMTQGVGCTCGYNNNGLSYCPLFPGDVEATLLLTMWKKWFGSEEVNSCNVFNRVESLTFPWCMQYGYKNYKDLLFQSLKVEFYPYIVSADPCYLQAVSPAYYAALHASDFSAVLSLGAALWVAG